MSTVHPACCPLASIVAYPCAVGNGLDGEVRILERSRPLITR